MNDDELAQGLRRALRDSETVDGMTAAKLRAARARALDAAPAGRPWLWAVPAAAMAVLVAALWLPATPPAMTQPPPVNAAGSALAADALDVLVDEQAPDFYQDLELYEWLEQEGSSA